MTSQYLLDLHLLPEVATARSHLVMVAAPAMPRTSEITFLTLLILSGRHPMVRRAADNRSTQLLSSVLSVLSDSQEPTTYALISEHTRMSGLSFARFAAKHSPANTTASVMRVCTLVRRSSFVAALFRVAQAGAVVAGLLAQMPWADTSGRKLVVSASNHYWMKRRRKDRRHGLKNSSRLKLPQGWWHHSPCWPSHTWT